MPARILVILITAALSFTASSGRTATLQWDTNPFLFGAQGGSGNWLGASTWWNSGDSTWVSASGASFGPTAGTVTVNGAVTADSLSFSTGGYTISGISTLTLSGADTIEVTNSSDTATISAPIGGTSGFSKTGAGTLTFSGSTANSYSGTATVTDGTLNLSKSAGVNSITGNIIIGAGNDTPSSVVVTQGADNQIADTAVVTINQDGFWNLASGNRSETIGGLVMTECSVATGTGMLTVKGDVQVKSGPFDNTYPNSTISGLLNLGGATRTFTIAPGITIDVSAAISNGGLTIAGLLSGGLMLSGTVANTYSGATTVSNGTLNLSKPAGVNAVGGNLIIGDGSGSPGTALVTQGANGQISTTATLTIAADGEWDLGGHSQIISALTMTGGFVQTGAGVLTLNGNITSPSGATSGIAGQLNLGGATRVVDVSSGASLSISAAVANGTGGLTKTGAGTVLLEGETNTFTGPVAINGGMVQVVSVADSGVSSSLGAGSSISLDGGTLVYYPSFPNGSSNRDVTLNATGGTVAVANAPATLTLSGTISGLGGLTKSGPGTVVLGGTSANTYAGATTAPDGGLVLCKPAGVNAVTGNLSIGDGAGAAASAILTQGNDEQIPDSATVAIASDGLWNLASGNHSETIAALAMTGGSIATGGGTLTVNGNISTNASAASATISGQLNLGGATRTLDVADGAAAIDLDTSAAISNGAGGVTKTSAGTLQLSGANNFSGPVAVNAGTLIAHGGNAIGDASDVAVASGATLTIDGNESIASLAGAGATTITSGNTLTVAGVASTMFTGSLNGAGGLTKTGSGSLNITAQATYTGNTLINGGTLALNSGLATGSGTMTVSAPGTLQAKGVVPRAVSGDGTITAIGTLTIGDGSSASGFAFGGTLTVGSNFVSLADADSAQLGALTTLANFGRLDSINGLTLASGRSVTATANAAISGSLVNNGTVNGPATSGQSLTLLGDTSGTGNYTGHVDFAAHVSPGASAAVVSLENFTLDSTATLAMELGGATAGSQYDQLNFTGAGVLGGTLDVSLINSFNPQQGQAFTLFSGGTLSGGFNSIQLPALSNGLMWSTSQLYTSGVLSVGLAGDFNGNGVVDAADYVIWRKRLGSVYAEADYDVWRAHYDQTAGSGSGTSVNAAVPEPTNLALLMLAAAYVYNRRTCRAFQKLDCV